jgi:hypothetical protein
LSKICRKFEKFQIFYINFISFSKLTFESFKAMLKPVKALTKVPTGSPVKAVNLMITAVIESISPFLA